MYKPPHSMYTGGWVVYISHSIYNLYKYKRYTTISYIRYRGIVYKLYILFT